MTEFRTEMNIKEGINKADIQGGTFKFIQGFEILSLKSQERFLVKSRDCEIGLVVLSGRCSLEVKGKIYENIGSREGVFKGKATAAYIPLGEEVEVRSNGGQIALCYSKCDKKTEFALFSPQEIKVMQVGKDNWQREVRIMIGPESPSVNLIVGETINPAGNWSGTPPHKHENTNLPRESLHEELYYFKTDKPQGFGIQRIYSYDKGINELIYLKDNLVTFMPWGYHQIVAGPGYTLYYLFFLSGQGKVLSGSVDSAHKWINE